MIKLLWIAVSRDDDGPLYKSGVIQTIRDKSMTTRVLPSKELTPQQASHMASYLLANRHRLDIRFLPITQLGRTGWSAEWRMPCTE